MIESPTPMKALDSSLHDCSSCAEEPHPKKPKMSVHCDQHSHVSLDCQIRSQSDYTSCSKIGERSDCQIPNDNQKLVKSDQDHIDTELTAKSEKGKAETDKDERFEEPSSSDDDLRPTGPDSSSN